MLVLLVAPSAAAPADAVITVATISDATNGDIRTVAGLIADPGPDGISLREALHATNNDPGSHTIGFAPSLLGRTITVNSDELPALTGGGVTVDGDIDGNGTPDVTVRSGLGKAQQGRFEPQGLAIASSGNRLHALVLEGFGNTVWFRPPQQGKGLPSHLAFVDNVVSGLVIRDAVRGILLTYDSNSCGLPRPQPCQTFYRWANTTFTGNTIEAVHNGIKVDLRNSLGDRLEHFTVTDNTIRLGQNARPAEVDVALQFSQGGNSTQNQISDVLIARNSIEGVNGAGIFAALAGAERAERNTIDGVRVLDNRIHLVNRGSEFCCAGVAVVAGSDAPLTIQPNVRPLRYPDGNVVRNVEVRGNTISGTLEAGVSVTAGGGAGGSRNRIESVQIAHNVIRSSKARRCIWLLLGRGEPYKHRYATGNRISGVTIDGNRVTMSPEKPLSFVDTRGAIVLESGGSFGRR